MGYSPKHLCRELCNATSVTLNSFFDTDRTKEMCMYVFFFAKACYLTINTVTGTPRETTFEMFCNGNITVHLDAFSEQIYGYIGEERVYEAEIHPEIAEILFELGMELYAYLKHKDTLTVIHETLERDITYDLLA